MLIYLIYLVINSPQNRAYNYGLGYISSVLKKNGGHNVKLISICKKSELDNLYNQVGSEKPGIVAFSSTSSQYVYVKQIARELKKKSDCMIVCGGIHTTLVPESINDEKSIDAVVIGEGEYPMLELANAIDKGEDYYKIKNIWFRKGDVIIKNRVRPLIENINSLPFPDKKSLDYQKVISGFHNMTNFIFSRGCPFMCTYCSNRALSSVYPNKSKYYRVRSVDLAIEEVERDVREYNFDYIVFDDDTISLNKEWFYDFFTKYKRRFTVPFRCNLRVGTVDEEMISLLKSSGASGIGIGIEHGNEKFRRDVLKRNISNEQIEEIFKWCDKYGLKHNDFIMVGFPYENVKLFKDTVRLCRKISAVGKPSIFQPYPKTELGNICEEKGWLPDKKEFKEREEAVISFPGFSKEQIQLCSDVYPVLMRNKWVPLFVPLFVVKLCLSFYKKLVKKFIFLKHLALKY